MKETFFSARKAFPIRSFTLFDTFFLLTLTYSMQETDQCNINKIMDLFHNEWSEKNLKNVCLRGGLGNEARCCRLPTAHGRRAIWHRRQKASGGKKSQQPP
jgi:hypothetical protein